MLLPFPPLTLGCPQSLSWLSALSAMAAQRLKSPASMTWPMLYSLLAYAYLSELPLAKQGWLGSSLPASITLARAAIRP